MDRTAADDALLRLREEGAAAPWGTAVAARQREANLRYEAALRRREAQITASCGAAADRLVELARAGRGVRVPARAAAPRLPHGTPVAELHSLVRNGPVRCQGMSVEQVLRRLYRQKFGAPPVSILEMAGDGSPRKLYRLVGDGMETTAVGVVGPDADENRAFLAFSRAFRSIGLPVPEIYGVDEAAGAYVEEDLGETTLFDAVVQARREDPEADFPARMVPVYRRILELLPRFQVEGGRAVDYSLAYPRAAFDRQSILWDLNYFKYHFLKLAHIPFNEARLEKDFRRFATFLLGADTRHFLYRDFQSRNVMLRDGEPWFIDYQGGRRGALQYDVASLLYDPKVGIPQALREELLEHYLAALEEQLPVDRDRFRQHLRGYVLVRIMQAMGAYGYRGFYERKPRFLQSVPQAVRNVELLLETGFVPVELPEMRAVFERICRTAALRRGPAQTKPGLTVHVGSFSFKRGYPDDVGGHGGGFVFDVRAIHNPGRYAEYTSLCGSDRPVIDFLEAQPEVEGFWEHVRGLVENHVGVWLTRGFSSLTVNFGCTGGQHRSVYFAERLAAFLATHYPSVHVSVAHREEGHWPPREQQAVAEAGAAAGAAE